VIQCTGVGIELKFVDKSVLRNTFIDVGMESNTGPALRVIGARFTRLVSCWGISNTTPIDLKDDTNAAYSTLNTVQGFRWEGGGLNGGAINLRDSLVGVVFEGTKLEGVAFTLTVPQNNVLLLDCVEDSAVTISGIGTALTRRSAAFNGASSGTTTNNTATKAWSSGPLSPGSVVFLEAKVLARQLNGTNLAEYWVAQSAKRPGSTLAYYNKTASFTVGQFVTGATSGARGLITADAGGTNGPLTLSTITGAFIADEVITDGAGGAAVAQSVLAAQNAALLGSLTSVRAAREDNANLDVAFAAAGGEIELRVTGDTAQTYAWVVDVEMRAN
jgi:hypothetical protein